MCIATGSPGGHPTGTTCDEKTGQRENLVPTLPGDENEQQDVAIADENVSEEQAPPTYKHLLKLWERAPQLTKDAKNREDQHYALGGSSNYEVGGHIDANE